MARIPFFPVLNQWHPRNLSRRSLGEGGSAVKAAPIFYNSFATHRTTRRTDITFERLVTRHSSLVTFLNIMKTEKKRSSRLRKSTPLPACPGCKMIKNEWPGEGYTHDGETYCCQGCAEGTGCTCVTVGKPGFSRQGQKLTRAEARPGEQRSGAPAPRGELSGERDNLGTAEALDQGG